MYVIQRLDQGGGFVARRHSLNGYTNDITKAQTFLSRLSAQAHGVCENEQVVSLEYFFVTPE